MNKKRRKICFVITSEIHYSRSKLILKELRSRKDVDLRIVVGASAILPNYGNVVEHMKRNGFVPDAKILMTVEGGNPTAMAKSIGLGLIDFVNVFENMQPDIVLVRGDRYEVLSAVIAAVNLNIPVAHIEGGDVSGTLDESIRHAITKFAHIHFPTNEMAQQRITSMGEDPKYVFNVGAAEVELVKENTFKVTNKEINKFGVGVDIDINKPYLIVMNHPVTTEYGKNMQHTEELLEAIDELGMQAIWFWPNVDAGTDEISKAMRIFRELKKPQHIHFLKYIVTEKFYALLKGTSCLVGNSSAGIKECSYFGVPVVNIGTRQRGRARAGNVVDVDYKKNEIKKAVQRQVKHGKYPKAGLYYKKGTSKRIADILSTVRLYTQKSFNDTK